MGINCAEDPFNIGMLYDSRCHSKRVYFEIPNTHIRAFSYWSRPPGRQCIGPPMRWTLILIPPYQLPEAVPQWYSSYIQTFVNKFTATSKKRTPHCNDVINGLQLSITYPRPFVQGQLGRNWNCCLFRNRNGRFDAPCSCFMFMEMSRFNVSQAVSTTFCSYQTPCNRKIS